MHAPANFHLSAAKRWWIYQRERFPIVQNGALILAFSFCAVSFSRSLRDESGLPSSASLLVAFATCFLFFLQLRIADEFKDYEEDSQFRPYRPVPSGLVRLRDLGCLFVVSAIVQLSLALWLDPQMALLLFVPWLYLAGMSREFFARDWLKARPVTYLWSHMLIMPLVDLYATGCDWLAGGHAAPSGLFWFLAASFFNGVVLEIGRKIRSPQDEEIGVQTYTVLWGPRRAPIIWLWTLVAAGSCTIIAAAQIGIAHIVGSILALVLLVCAGQAVRFRTEARPGSGKAFETLSGIWTLTLYGSLGGLPLFIQ